MGVDFNDDHDDVYTFNAQGAQFLDVGSFNKKEQASLDKRWEEIEKAEENSGPDRPRIVVTHGMKAKRFKDD
jgi:hypothetical protein